MKATDRTDESFRKGVERNIRREQGHGLVGKFHEAFGAQESSIEGEYVCGPVGENQQYISRFDPNTLLRVEFASDKADGWPIKSFSKRIPMSFACAP